MYLVMERTALVVPILEFLRTMFFYKMPNALLEFHQRCEKTFLSLITQMILVTDQEGGSCSIDGKREGGGEEECQSCKKKLEVSSKLNKRDCPEGSVTEGDVEMVMERLGMWNKREDEKEVGSSGGCDGKCRDYWVLEGALILLEEKEASMEELEEAFLVFDEDRDEFITAGELQRVLRRLGFEEGSRLEDCRRMVMAFDEDGDGRINFSEFKNMLENVR